MPENDKSPGEFSIKPERADEARLAEYEALRAESDRITQLLSNAVWAGITGFGLTLAGAAALGDRLTAALIVPSAALLLCIQSLAISIVYASELWKYIRVGTYIREYIEPYFQLKCGSIAAPMHWESWIVQHRARALHLAALFFLQSPIIVTVLGWAMLVYIQLQSISAAEETTIKYVKYLASDTVLAILLCAVSVLDVILMVVLWRKLRQAEKGDFGDGGESLKELEIAVRGACQ